MKVKFIQTLLHCWSFQSLLCGIVITGSLFLYYINLIVSAVLCLRGSYVSIMKGKKCVIHLRQSWFLQGFCEVGGHSHGGRAELE